MRLRETTFVIISPYSIRTETVGLYIVLLFLPFLSKSTDITFLMDSWYILLRLRQTASTFPRTGCKKDALLFFSFPDRFNFHALRCQNNHPPAQSVVFPMRAKPHGAHEKVKTCQYGLPAVLRRLLAARERALHSWLAAHPIGLLSIGSRYTPLCGSHPCLPCPT